MLAMSVPDDYHDVKNSIRYVRSATSVVTANSVVTGCELNYKWFNRRLHMHTL